MLRIYHLDRGYDGLVEKLRPVGARVVRVSDGVQGADRLRAALDAADRGGAARPSAEA